VEVEKQNNLIIGSHVSFNKKDQLIASVKEAISYNATTFMFYTGAPQNTIRKALDENLTKEAKDIMKKNNIKIENVICHAPYIINLANNSDEDKYQFSQNFLRSEINRCLELGIKYLVLHPGSAVKLDTKTAINNIINALNNILKPDDDIMILLETMAGKGSEIGSKMEELSTIINNLNLQDKVGVCLDTCHLNDSGVDLNNFDEYLNEFDNLIGINKIKCVHINDSKNPLSSFKDRHANIGYGTIGFDLLLKIIYHDKLKDVPKILETPYIEDNPPYKYEIDMILKQEFNPNLINDVINN
jgi:deoxyribonuclease-4